MRSFFTILLKTLLFLFLTGIGLLVGAMLAVQIPAVQTKLAQKGAEYLSEKLLFPVTIGGVSIKWFDSLTLEDISILDRQNRKMITVGRLDANYNLRNLIDSSAHNLHIDEVVLYRPNVQMIKNPVNGDTNLDDFIARIEELTTDPNNPGIPDQNVPFTIGRVTLADGSYTLFDPREPLLNDPKSFDYDHFTIQHINADATNLLVLGDTIALTIKGMSGVDRESRLHIRRLDTRLLYCNTKLELADLDARIGNSVIRNGITFLYDKPSAFGHFNSQVRMRADFRNSVIQAKDLGFFSDYLRGLNETWRLTGNFYGTVDDFTLAKTDLRFGPGGRSRLVGNMAWTGLPDMDNTRVGFAFAPSVVHAADIRQYYPDPAFNRVIQPFGQVNFDLKFAGTFADFRTSGTVKTALGDVAGNLDLSLATNTKPITYKADLTTQNLNLGQLIGQPGAFGRVDGAGRVTGSGTDLMRANIDVDAKLDRFGWQGYEYRNVTMRGNLQRALFHGQLGLRDPNASLVVDGDFDLSQPRNRFDLRGTVQRADLRALGFLTDSLVVGADLDVQLTGNTVDELTGDVALQNARLNLNNRSLSVGTLTLQSTIETRRTANPDSAGRNGGPTQLSAIQPGSQRYFDLESEFLTARMQGTFQPQQTLTDLTRLAREYRLYFMGDDAGLKAYYNRRNQADTTRTDRYGVDFQFRAKAIGPLMAFFAPSVYVAPATELEGRFTRDKLAFLTATLTTDSLNLDGPGFGRTTLDLTSSKYANAPDVLASAVLTSANQTLTSLLPTRNLVAEASWDVDRIAFTSRIEQADGTNQADLNGDIQFKGDAIDLTFRPSRLRVLDADWRLNPQSLIRKVGDAYTIRNLSVQNQDQLIRASGQISADTAHALTVDAQDFRLASLNSVLRTELGGRLNGQVSVRNLYQQPIVESRLTVDTLMYNKALIGDLRSQLAWDQTAERLNVNADVIRNGVGVLNLTGNYTPAQTQNPLALTARLTDANLRILETFTVGLFSNMAGLASGQIAITGQPAAPVLKGELAVKGGRGRFDYLNTDFTFDDKIYFGENDIIARQLTLRDPNGNTALVRGGVYHDGFRYFTLGFDADFKNFQIMNTAAKDNELFYGQAIVTGKAELYGPLNNLQLRANASTNKGTRIFIPLDGATSVASDDRIRFVNRSGQKTADPTKPSGTTTSTAGHPAGGHPAGDHPVGDHPVGGEIDLSRMQMDFNFDITPDAYCEIQLDRQTGDIIKAYGQGRLGMKVDTDGDFSMTGSYEIQKGDYTFTFQNVINKRFQIKPSSRITWTGDPYGALLDVSAAYTQYTSLAPLLATAGNTSTRPTADQTRRYPVDLVIKLTGELAAPAISYDLDVKQYPAQSDFRQAVTSFESRLQSNEQELTRQVSSVLLFNQLLPEGTGLFDQGQVGAGLANSVSELLSNQLSRIVSNLDENLDVGVSVGGLGTFGAQQNDNLLNNLQLRFSYRFLNDRLRISRDGGFTYGQSQYNAASLLGEWTLEYVITPDGRLRAKMYNRNQQSVLGQNTLNSTITTGGGLSLLYTRSFNRFFAPRRPEPGIPPAPPVRDETAPGAVTTFTGRGEIQ